MMCATARGRDSAVSLLLFDTTFLIDAERNQDDLDELIADDDDIAIAAITVAEINAGIQLAAPSRRPRRQTFVDEIVDLIPILPYDKAVALHHATLLAAVHRAGRPRGPTTSSSPRPP